MDANFVFNRQISKADAELLKRFTKKLGYFRIFDSKGNVSMFAYDNLDAVLFEAACRYLANPCQTLLLEKGGDEKQEIKNEMETYSERRTILKNKAIEEVYFNPS